MTNWINDDLPKGWAWATLTEIVDFEGVFIDGDWVESKDQDPNGDVRLIQLADIGDGIFRNRSDRFMTMEKAIELDCTFLQPNDLLIARMPDPLGRACIFPGDEKPSVTVVDVCIVRTTPISHKWLMYAINSANIRADIASYQSGSTRKRISRGNLAKVQLPVAPLNEQHRIVDEIEAQFSRLDTWLDTMEKLRSELPRLRASILKAAVEGRLVAQDPNDESAEVLLQRILNERRHKWEEDYLANLEAQGKPAPKNDKWKELYPEPEPPDTSDLPRLPDGWVWASIDEIAEVRGGVTKGRNLNAFATITVPYLRVANVQSGYLNLDEVKTIQIKTTELEKYRLLQNDILFTEGGDRDKLGRGTIWRGEIDVCIHQNHIFRARLYLNDVNAEWVSLISQAEYAREYFWDVASQTTNLASVNMTNLRALAVPLPPYQQQNRIIDAVNAKFSLIERLLEIVSINTKRAERMRQSILKQAFEGRLVEQDADDEPASELLERILEERKRRTEEEKKKPNAPRKAKVSTKMGPKSLYDTLKEAGKSLTPEKLFVEAGFSKDLIKDIDDFYEELRVEMQNKRITQTILAGNSLGVVLQVSDYAD